MQQIVAGGCSRGAARPATNRRRCCAAAGRHTLRCRRPGRPRTRSRAMRDRCSRSPMPCDSCAATPARGRYAARRSASCTARAGSCRATPRSSSGARSGDRDDDGQAAPRADGRHCTILGRMPARRAAAPALRRVRRGPAAAAAPLRQLSWRRTRVAARCRNGAHHVVDRRASPGVGRVRGGRSVRRRDRGAGRRSDDDGRGPRLHARRTARRHA